MEIHPALATEEQQRPEHADPIPVQIFRRRLGPGADQPLEGATSIRPMVQEAIQCGRSLRQLLPMGQGRHLGHGVTSAEGPGTAPASAGGVLLLQLGGRGLKAPDQLSQGHRSLQGWSRHKTPPQVILGMQGQSRHRLRFISSFQIAPVLKDVLLVPVGLQRQDVLLQNPGLQRHQNGGRQKSLAALRQVLFITATVTTGQPG